MRMRLLVVIVAFALGVGGWVLDAILDASVMNEPVQNMLLNDTTTHEFYVRLLALIAVLTGGILLFFIMKRRDQTFDLMKDRHQYFNLLFQHASDGIFVFRSDGNLVDMNLAGRHMMRYSGEDILETTAEDMLTCDQPHSITGKFKALSRGGVACFEARLACLDGSVVAVEVSASYQTMDGGRHVCLVRDIAHRKRSEAERDASLRLAQVLSGSFEHREMLKDLGAVLRDWSGCRHVVIRLPLSNPLCGSFGLPGQSASGHDLLVRRGSRGLPCQSMEETGYFTKLGSFWTNHSSQLDQDWLTELRHELGSIESLAIIPIVLGEDQFGSLILADGEAGLFSLEKIVTAERLTASIGLGLAKLKAVLSLQQSEAKFHHAFKNAPLLISMINIPEATYAEVNAAFSELTGYMPEQAIGKTPLELGLIVPEINDRLTKRLREEGKVRNYELELRHADGRKLTFLYSGEVVEINGKRWLISISADITERKKADLAFRESMIMLEESVKAGNVGLFDFDPRTDKVVYSEQWKRQLGYESHEIQPSLMEWRKRLHPEDLPGAIGRLQAVLAGISAEYQSEYRMLHRDGTYRSILAQATVFTDESGEVNRILGSHMDITQLRQAESALHRSESRMQNVLDASPMGMHFYTLRGNQLELSGFNPAAEEILRIQHEELLGEPVQRAFPALAGSDLAQRFLQVAHTGVVIQDEQVVYKGKEIEEVFEIHAFQPQKGQVAIMFADITERRRVEQTIEAIHEGTAGTIGSAFFKRLVHCLGTLLEVRYVIAAKLTGPMKARTVAMWNNGECHDDFEYDLEGTPCEVVVNNATTTYASGLQASFPDHHLLKEMAAESYMGTPLRDSQGKAIGMLVVLDVKPISQEVFFQRTLEVFAARTGAELARQEAEAALAQREEHLRILFQEAADAIFVASPDGALVTVNQQACQVTGYEQGELMRKNLRDLDSSLQGMENLMLEFDCQGGAGTMIRETHFTCKDGHDLPVEVSTSKMETPSGLRLLKIVRDITDRRNAEAERERLLSAIEQAAETILITDAKGFITYANPAFERRSGYMLKEVRGKTPNIVRSGEHDEAFYHDLWTTILRGDTWRGRLVNRAKNGTLFTEDAVISPVLDLAGNIVNFVSVKHDVTEQLQLAKELQQAQKMQAVGRLAGGVAHDFNNMLGVILGRAEMLMEISEDLPSHQAGLTEILSATQRSAQLTRQLLAFARKQVISPQYVDLNDAIAGMTKMLGRLIGENIQLVWSPAANLPTVLIDPNQIDQILANLCINARDAIEDTGRLFVSTGVVELAGEFEDVEPGNYVMLAVQDNGCGMDEETMNNIFEPFFTTKPMGQGTGLGLATVYGIVKQNNGAVTVESEVGNGTTFRIYLPAQAAAVPDQEEKAESKLARAKGEVILLVEDEQLILQMTKQVLGSLGYQVLACSNPMDAREMIHEHNGRVDLLLTDVVMPEKNGWDLARQLQSEFPEMQCLLMSGYPINHIPKLELLSSGVEFLEKPFTLHTLSSRIRSILDRARGSTG